MAKSKEVRCQCGGTYDDKGICGTCGKKRLRSAGYRVWHGFLCAVAVLILIGCINANLCVRDYMRNTRLSNGIEDSRISDFTIPTVGKTVAAYVNEQYLKDYQLSDDSVEKIINAMDIEDLISEKLTDNRKLLEGSSDTVVKISDDELTDLLDNAEDTIYKQAKLHITDSDKEDLRDESAASIRKFNNLMSSVYGSTFGKLLARFGVSIWRLILDAVLLILVCWRWMVVRRNSGAPKRGVLHSVGLLLLIPAAILLVGLTVIAIYSLIRQSSEIGLYPLANAIRVPLWFIFGAELLLGIILLVIAGIMKNAAKKKSAAAETAPQPVAQPVAQPAPAPAPAPAPTPAPAPVQTKSLPAADTDPVRRCVSCGQPISPKAMFCKSCGSRQPAPQAASEASEASAAQNAEKNGNNNAQ